MRPIHGALKILGDSLTTPMATFSKILWAFVPMVPPERALKSSYRHSMHIIPLSALGCSMLILDCSFEWGMRTPNFGEGEAVWGREWYRSKERW